MLLRLASLPRAQTAPTWHWLNWLHALLRQRTAGTARTDALVFLTALCVITALCLGGCATPETLNAQGVPLHRLEALRLAYPGVPFDIAVVKSSGYEDDELANTLIQWGWSNAGISQIAQLLQTPGHPFIAVIGERDQLAAAIAVRALGEVKGKALASNTLFFVGEASLRPQLEQAAEASTVNFRFVPYPQPKAASTPP